LRKSIPFLNTKISRPLNHGGNSTQPFDFLM